MRAVSDHVRAGISTEELDDIAANYMQSINCTSACYKYRGFPKHTCISVNDTVVHGIPSPSIILKDGDVVKIDIACKYNGYYGDMCWTFGINTSPEDQSLINTTLNALKNSIKKIKTHKLINVIGKEIADTVLSQSQEYQVVKNYIGHGIGQQFHEAPNVYSYYRKTSTRIKNGMVFTIEPIILSEDSHLYTAADCWSVITENGAKAAQWECTVAIIDDQVEILTELPDDS